MRCLSLLFIRLECSPLAVRSVRSHKQPPFWSPANLSVDSLAWVCVSPWPQSNMALPRSPPCTPAVYGPTGEAVLMRGSLIQLEDKPVQLQQSQIADSDQLKTATCRFTVFRDETSLD